MAASSSEERIARVEQTVAAIASKVDGISQPTNWYGIAGALGGVFAITVAFIQLITGPIKEALADMKADMALVEQRMHDHTADGHPKRVEEQVEALREADLQRQQMRDEQIRLLREEMKQIEDYTHRGMERKR